VKKLEIKGGEVLVINDETLFTYLLIIEVIA